MDVRKVRELFPHTHSRVLMCVLSMFFSFEEFLISPVPPISPICPISPTSTPSIFNWISRNTLRMHHMNRSLFTVSRIYLKVNILKIIMNELTIDYVLVNERTI